MLFGFLSKQCNDQIIAICKTSESHATFNPLHYLQSTQSSINNTERGDIVDFYSAQQLNLPIYDTEEGEIVNHLICLHSPFRSRRYL